MAERKIQKNGVTLEEYTKIKTWLQVPNISNVEIEKLSGRSWPTIRNIKNSTDYDNYHALVAESSKKNNALRDKITSKMSFGERQEDDERQVEPVGEPTQPKDMTKFDELMALEKEMMETKRQLLDTENRLLEQNKLLVETLILSNQAMNNLAEAINS